MLVFKKYDIAGGQVIGMPPIKDWYWIEDRPVIYTAFEKIMNEVSLLRFVSNYGLPEVAPDAFHRLGEIPLSSNKTMDKLPAEADFVREYPLRDSVDDIIREAGKLRYAHFALAQKMKVEMDPYIKIPGHGMNSVPPYYAEADSSGFNNLDDEILRYAKARYEIPMWNGSRYVRHVVYDSVVAAIWFQFYTAVTRTDRETKQCPECGILHEWYKDFCNDGTTKVSRCYNRKKIRDRNLKKKDPGAQKKLPDGEEKKDLIKQYSALVSKKTKGKKR